MASKIGINFLPREEIDANQNLVKIRQFDEKRVNFTNVRKFHAKSSYILEYSYTKFKNLGILRWFHEKFAQATNFGINIIKYFS